MNELLNNGKFKIENMIYEINGVQVMTAYDLAKLYHCKNGTKEINQAVKNNPHKFPQRYSWILTEEENYDFLVKNFDQKNTETRGGRFKRQRVFTEQGVAMLATILHTDVAVDISIQIMDAFVRMRHFISNNKDIYISLNTLNNKFLEHDEKINYLFSIFDKKEQLFLNNETYNAYISVLNIINSANNELIVIDNFADITFFNLIRKIKCDVILITRNSDRLTDLEIEKYNKQYHNLKVIRNNNFHDRFYIIDRKEIYQSGASINNAGDKIFMIIKIENVVTKNKLLDAIKKVLDSTLYT